MRMTGTPFFFAAGRQKLLQSAVGFAAAHVHAGGQAGHRYAMAAQGFAQGCNIAGILRLKTRSQRIFHSAEAHRQHQLAQLVQGLGFPGFCEDRKLQIIHFVHSLPPCVCVFALTHYTICRSQLQALYAAAKTRIARRKGL